MYLLELGGFLFHARREWFITDLTYISYLNHQYMTYSWNLAYHIYPYRHTKCKRSCMVSHGGLFHVYLKYIGLHKYSYGYILFLRIHSSYGCILSVRRPSNCRSVVTLGLMGQFWPPNFCLIRNKGKKQSNVVLLKVS